MGLAYSSKDGQRSTVTGKHIRHESEPIIPDLVERSNSCRECIERSINTCWVEGHRCPEEYEECSAGCSEEECVRCQAEMADCVLVFPCPVINCLEDDACLKKEGIVTP